MIIKSPKDLYNMYRELSYFKKEFPKIKVLFEHFDNSENPRESLEKIISAARANPLTDDFLKITRTYDAILRAEENAEKQGWPYACLELLKETGVDVKVKGIENIPVDDSTLYITNHPYGLLDSATLLGNLGSALEKRGKDLKLIAMNQLRFIKGSEKVLQFVHSTTSSSNLKVLKESAEYLEKGGNLAICPAGTMSGPGLREYPWERDLSFFISHASYVVPIWFSGPNHEGLYNLLARSKQTEKLRRVLSFREAWNKSGKTLYMNIGDSIPSEGLMEIKDKKARMNYLRKRAEALKIKR